MNDPAYVAALERQNRLLRRLTVACFGLLVVAVACAADVIPTSLIVQEEFLVKDRDGITRFEMVVNKVHGRSNGFHVVDMNGQTRIDIGITDAGQPVIAFLDPAGRVIRTLP
jgi:hypothetical protein